VVIDPIEQPVDPSLLRRRESPQLPGAAVAGAVLLQFRLQRLARENEAARRRRRQCISVTATVTVTVTAIAIVITTRHCQACCDIHLPWVWLGCPAVVKPVLRSVRFALLVQGGPGMDAGAVGAHR
jgi:hypothetical protein